MRGAVTAKQRVNRTANGSTGACQHWAGRSSASLHPATERYIPPLHKLEQEGWITAEWGPSENNRRAKFYSLTRMGRRQLERETENWTRLSDAITQVVKLKEA